MTTARRHFRRHDAAAGFTLIEVMCVVVVLAIAAAIVVPMTGAPDVRLSAAQRAVLADLQYAQGLAVAGRKAVYVRCAANQYELCTLSGATLVQLAHPVDPGKYVVKFGATAKGRALRDVAFALPTFGASDRTLAFDATGVPFTYNDATATKSSLAARSTLTLSAAGQSRVVYVEAFTGELRVP